MKKMKFVLFGAAALLLLASCGSKPEIEDEVTPEAPTEIVDSAATEDDEAAAEAARKAAEEEAARKAAEEEAARKAAEEEAAKKAATEKDAEARKAAKKAYDTAKSQKAKIDENNLAGYDQKRYDEAEALLAEYEAIMNDSSVSGEELQKKAEDILGKYNTVCIIGFKKLAKDARDVAYESKKLADSVKAGVAQKETYKEAVDNFKEGDALYAMQAAEKACGRYKKADEIFSDLYKTVSEKRAAAQAAIEAAKKRVAEVEDIAIDADHIKPITDENQEGIEKEDAVLLEEETYADPKDAEADVPETIAEAVVEEIKEITVEIKNIGGDK